MISVLAGRRTEKHLLLKPRINMPKKATSPKKFVKYKRRPTGKNKYKAGRFV